MEASNNAINEIKEHEGFRANTYLDSKGVPTIGWGSIMYKTGIRVKMGETITMADAEILLMWEATNKSHSINGLLGNTVVNQNQFDALLSFTYNEGVGALTSSTLLKKIKINPNDEQAIRFEFSRWNKINVEGKYIVNAGLTTRRAKEADLYFS
jgi:lysozyme